MSAIKKLLQKILSLFLSREKKEVIATLQAYADSFMTFDPDNVLGYFEIPMMYFADDGSHVFESQQQVRDFLVMTMKELQAKSYAKDELSKFHIKSLTKDVVVTSFHLNRVDTAGKVFGRFGAMYTWHKTNGIWKVVIGVLLTHK